MPLVVVELSILQHLNVITFHEEATVFDNQQRPANSPRIRINPDFSVTDVPNHGYLSVNDVHLSSKLSESQHQLLGIAMNTDLPQKIELNIRQKIKIFETLCLVDNET